VYTVEASVGASGVDESVSDCGRTPDLVFGSVRPRAVSARGVKRPDDAVVVSEKDTPVDDRRRRMDGSGRLLPEHATVVGLETEEVAVGRTHVEVAVIDGRGRVNFATYVVGPVSASAEGYVAFYEFSEDLCGVVYVFGFEGDDFAVEGSDVGAVADEGGRRSDRTDLD